MDYGRMITEVLHAVLEEEERTLATALRKGLSVRPLYHEHWLQYLIFRKSLQMQACPRVGFEYGKIDVTFFDGNDDPLARFELKGPFTAGKAKWLPKILKDFDSQRKRVEEKPTTEHYVVLVACAEPANISDWLNRVLMPTIERKHPEVGIEGRMESGDILLNNRNEALRVITMKVRSRRSSAFAASTTTV